MHFEKDLYLKITKRLIVKTIEELYFEEIITLEEHDDGAFLLTINDNIYYKIKGKKSIWDNIHLNSRTLEKIVDDKLSLNISIAEFLNEINVFCKMSDDTLAKYIEEANQTLYSDMLIEQNLEKIDFNTLINQDYLYLDRISNGHPKIIMNKGRVGWSTRDISKYSPEGNKSFKLVWVAINRNIAISGFDKGIEKKLIEEFLGKKVFYKIDFKKYHVLAIHPWQWNRYINIQYLELIANNEIIYLGELGPDFFPQISLRTLSNENNSKFDLKLSLSILNTSCVRGIPKRFIEDGYKISSKLFNIIQNDQFISSKIEVLQEVGAISYVDKTIDSLKNCSYRYKELLGCVWRESVDSKLIDNEKAIPTASLFLNHNNTSFIESLINNSKLSPEQWIAEYTKTVIIPLYHLQVKHGIGLVSHGQNIILVHKNGVPSKLIIKDFHGDLRISHESPYINENSFKVIDRLSSNHLIHDLITGHFVTVLRYVSRILSESSILTEETFYKIIREQILEYCKINSLSNNSLLLKNEIEKILVNKVRFKVGYDELPRRPLPLLGSEIKNPLACNV